jgi:hypothetical protein
VSILFSKLIPTSRTRLGIDKLNAQIPRLVKSLEHEGLADLPGGSDAELQSRRPMSTTASTPMTPASRIDRHAILQHAEAGAPKKRSTTQSTTPPGTTFLSDLPMASRATGSAPLN